MYLSSSPQHHKGLSPPLTPLPHHSPLHHPLSSTATTTGTSTCSSPHSLSLYSFLNPFLFSSPSPALPSTPPPPASLSNPLSPSATQNPPAYPYAPSMFPSYVLPLSHSIISLFLSPCNLKCTLDSALLLHHSPHPSSHPPSPPLSLLPPLTLPIHCLHLCCPLQPLLLSSLRLMGSSPSSSPPHLLLRHPLPLLLPSPLSNPPSPSATRNLSGYPYAPSMFPSYVLPTSPTPSYLSSSPPTTLNALSPLHGYPYAPSLFPSSPPLPFPHLSLPLHLPPQMHLRLSPSPPPPFTPPPPPIHPLLPLLLSLLPPLTLPIHRLHPCRRM